MVALKPAPMHSLKTPFLTAQTTTQCVSEAFFAPQKGARYLNPQTGLWLSTDPAMGEYVPQAPINDEAKRANGNLAGMGGVFNVVNLHVYHYAGNNPVKYVDPDGRMDSKLETVMEEGQRAISAADAGLKIGNELIKSGEYLLDLGNNEYWYVSVIGSKEWRAAKLMIAEGSDAARLGRTFSRIGTAGKFMGVAANIVGLGKLGIELHIGNYEAATGIAGGYAGLRIGLKIAAYIIAIVEPSPVGEFLITVALGYIGSASGTRLGEAYGSAVYRSLKDAGFTFSQTLLRLLPEITTTHNFRIML